VAKVLIIGASRGIGLETVVDPRSWTCGFISRADVADFLVKQIDDNDFLYKTLVLTG
jgi:acyl CoA:acetate/3-ketoacid CoA transferase